MEPKFQSSFIPKGPSSFTPANPTGGTPTRRGSGGGLIGFLAKVIFIVSILAAVGVFGYKYYLKYSIARMGAELEEVRASLEPETIKELTRLHQRIVSTQQLIAGHEVITPLFDFLGASTPVTVRFKDFKYEITDKGIELVMRGEARGYTALAVQSDIFGESQYLQNPIFSDLVLNDRGDVNFSFRAIVDPTLVSYQRMIERLEAPQMLPAPTPASATSTIPGQGSLPPNLPN